MMDKAELVELLKQHLRLEVWSEKDFDSYGGSNTDVHVKLVWEDGGTETTISEGYGNVAHERRG